ncbi:MAG: CheR family methyltransferase [Desulfosoma sp.]
MDDADFRTVLGSFGLSWHGYRKVRKGARKRLMGLMARCDVGSVSAFLERCRQSEAMREEARRALAVPISRFFRDRRLWVVLETELLPGLIRWCGDPLRAWSAGCARGEEVYSLKILWHEREARGESMPSLELWATDFHPGFLDAGSEGVYHRSSLREVSSDRLSTFFVPAGGDRYAVSGFLKEGILWHQRDLLRDPPPSSALHLVFLRNNLLTYYEPPEQERALRPIVGSLVEGGFLVVGSRERPPPGTWPLMRCAAHPHLFRKVPFGIHFI